MVNQKKTRKRGGTIKIENYNDENLFQCPITQEIFKDPVVATDGFTYEKRAIEKWFAKNDRSPSTNQVLKSKMVIPNLILKQIIKNIAEKNKDFAKSDVTVVKWANVDLKKYVSDLDTYLDIHDSNGGDTLLHFATRIGDMKLAKKLIKNGIDIDSKNNVGDTALHIAAKNANESLFKFLLEKSSWDYLKNQEGETAIDIALESNNKVFAKKIRRLNV